MLVLLLSLSGCDLIGYGDTNDTDSGLDSGTETPTEQIDCSVTSFLGHQPEVASAGTLMGRIVSPSGTVPVSGATYTVDLGTDTASVISAEHGCFRLDLPAGDYALDFHKGRYTAAGSASITEDTVTDVGELALDQGDLKLAVVSGKYDSVGHIIDELGIDFDTFASPGELFANLDTLNNYDAVFANCGSDYTTLNGEAYSPEELANARAWVEAGGTLYTSDWEWSLFRGVAPRALVWGDDVLSGPQGTVQATIVDRNIQALLGGASAEITFDLPDWAMPEAAGTAQVLVNGTFAGIERPLAVMAFPGDGRAVFTAFHNESQITRDMQVILYELVLALSSERTDAVPPVSASGVVYQFQTHTPLEGATVSLAQDDTITTTTDADGAWTLHGVPNGSEFTPVASAAGHVVTHQQTFTADADVEQIYLQLVPEAVFGAMAQGIGQAGVTVDLTEKCHVVTTVSSAEAGEYTTWAEFLDHGDAGLLPDATAQISPSSGMQLYFNEQVQPDPTLSATTTDGGVLWVNVDPGRYTLSATHSSASFPDVTVDCEKGRFVNASPPNGLTALGN